MGVPTLFGTSTVGPYCRSGLTPSLLSEHRETVTHDVKIPSRRIRVGGRHMGLRNHPRRVDLGTPTLRRRWWGTPPSLGTSREKGIGVPFTQRPDPHLSPPLRIGSFVYPSESRLPLPLGWRRRVGCVGRKPPSPQHSFPNGPRPSTRSGGVPENRTRGTLPSGTDLVLNRRGETNLNYGFHSVGLP